MKKLLRKSKAAIALLIIISIMSSLTTTAAFAQVEEASVVADTGGQVESVESSVSNEVKGHGEEVTPITPGEVILGDNRPEGANISNVASDLRGTGGGPRIVGKTLGGSESQAQALMQESIAPIGAVMAFNNTTCPSGWTPYTEAEGRMIIGAGNGYALGEVDGSETHVQTIAEMAQHSHSNNVTSGQGNNSWVYHVNQNGYKYSPGNNTINFASVAQFSGMIVSVGGVGGGQPMDIMNPYVALIFCEKIVDNSLETPAGAVSAFASTTCPSGWEPFEAAEGRRIIGAGQNDSSEYSVGDTGGNSTVSQTVNELPFHSHGVTVSNPNGSNSWVYNLNQVGYQYLSGSINATFVSVGQFASVNVNIHNAGQGAPMDIMNPYVVLNYCVKVATDAPNDMPAGAVAPFNSDTCPSGWEPYNNAEGRMVIGKGEGYALGSTGGSDTHIQTLAELAPHSHTASLSGGNSGGNSWMNSLNQNNYSNTDEFQGVNYIPSGQFATPQVNIQSAGQSAAMDIMNPYVVLNYCGFQVDGGDGGGETEEASFTVFPTALTIAENAGTSTFSVVLDVAPTSTVVFNITPSQDGEVSLSTTTLTFTPADWNVPQVITVTGINDDLDQNDSVILNVSVVDSASDDTFDPLADQTVTVTLTDDDTTGGGGGGDDAGFTVFPTSLTIAENGGQGTFSVVLDVAPASPVTLQVTPSKDGEVSLSTTTLVFAPADWNVPQIITVTGINDSLDQNDSVVLNVSVVDDASDNEFDPLADQQVNVSITDDDAAPTSGGGGGGSGDGRGFVLGVATGPLTCDTEIYLTKPVRLGASNNVADVVLLERFLNTYENANIPVDGFYSVGEFNMIVKWQEKHRESVLKPWGLNTGTGFVFITSLQQIKQTHKARCAESEVPTQILSCSLPVIYPMKEVKAGAANDAEAVKLVEKYLNTYEFASLPVDGVFSEADRAAVKKFQEKYAQEILAPDGLKQGTGDVLYRTLDKMKKIHTARCALFVVNPEF